MNKSLLIITILFLNLILNIKLSQSVVSSKHVKKRLFNQEPEVVFTKDGFVRGIITDTHRVWYGIPFARPPVAELRFEDPKPSRPWRHIRDGTVQREQCIQACGLGDSACSHVGTSEDCLYLDVFVPRTFDTSSSNLPVMMFIPGGAFTQGTGACPLYDSTHFANSSIIVVNVNYRLGALGFMGGDLSHGNYGFLDQVRALEWIRDNIEVFGGNKDRVTLYGQSAGGFSVVAHLASERSKGLFHRAIASSTPLTVGLKTKAVARGFANRFTGHLGCPIEDIDCLRSKTPDEIMAAQNKTGLGMKDKVLDMFTIWTPVVDCDIITGQPLTMIRDGLTHDVPIIIGDLKDEANLFIYMAFKKKIDPIFYAGMLTYLFPVNSLEVGIKYPCAKLDCRAQLSKLLTDYLFRCSGRYHVNKLVQLHKSPVYHYHYKHDSTGDAIIDECEGLSCHGDELSMVFNTYESALGMKLDDDEIQMAQDLSNYWVNFVTNNDPNIGITTPTMPTWSPITKTQNLSLVIESDLQTKDIISTDEKCNMFDKISYRRYTRPDSIICQN